MGWLRQWGVVVFLFIAGMGLVFYGVWDRLRPREVKVEIVKEQSIGEKVQDNGVIVADVAGAVEKPGVYKLPPKSRIGDVLVMAGGLAASADREWVAKTLNLAQIVEDGAKIYIPAKADNQIVGDSARQITSKPDNQKINVNTASIAELDKLEGIGEARAQAIVDNRPYSKTEEIVSKAQVPQSVYNKIKDSIAVY